MVDLTPLWTTGDTWIVPDGWQQGRGAWGGLVTGQILTSVLAQTVDHPELVPRSLYVAMLGPVMVGEVAVTVEQSRAGKSTVAHEVTLRSPDGATLTRATVISGRRREPTPVSAKVAELPPPPDPTQGVQVSLGAPLAPEFTGQLDFRPVSGFPFAGSDELVTEGWVGLGVGSSEILTPPIIAAMVDAYWIASIVGIDLAAAGSGIPFSTLDFAMHFPAEPPALTAEELWTTGLWHSGRVTGGRDGYITEERTLQAATGELLAVNMQLVAVGRGG